MASGMGTMSAFPGGFSGGMTVQGFPVWNMFATSAGPGQKANSGVFWVDSVNGADGNPGTYMQPLATLARAIATCKTRDWIMLAPGHAETISSNTALTLSVAKVAIYGCGQGPNRPTFTLDTANTTTINVTAAGITIANCIFVANFLSIAACFTLTTAAGFNLTGNQFRSTSASLNFGKLVLTSGTSNAADDLQLVNNAWFDTGTTSAQSVIGMVGTNTRLVVSGNYFSTAAITAAALMPITAGKLVTNAQITGNVFNLVSAQAATTGLLITTNGTTNSGILANNYIQSLDDTAPILVTASSGFIFMENYYQFAADKSGLLVPANA